MLTSIAYSPRPTLSELAHLLDEVAVGLADQQAQAAEGQVRITD